jgi:hypothetical protein
MLWADSKSPIERIVCAGMTWPAAPGVGAPFGVNAGLMLTAL